MKATRKDNIIEGIIRVIGTYSPEFIDQCEDASKAIYFLVDAIEKFEDELEEQVRLEKEKQDSLK